MGNFDAIIMHLQYYKAFSAISFENVWIKQNDKTNELLHLFPVSCTMSSRCHHRASCGGTAWSWLLAQRHANAELFCWRQTPSVAFSSWVTWGRIICCCTLRSWHEMDTKTLFVISLSNIPNVLFLHVPKTCGYLQFWARQKLFETPDTSSIIVESVWSHIDKENSLFLAQLLWRKHTCLQFLETTCLWFLAANTSGKPAVFCFVLF